MDVTNHYLNIEVQGLEFGEDTFDAYVDVEVSVLHPSKDVVIEDYYLLDVAKHSQGRFSFIPLSEVPFSFKEALENELDHAVEDHLNELGVI